jgi:hypothetical protein
MNSITSPLAYVIAPIFFSAQQAPMIRATIAELAGCGIATVANPRHVGRVYVFDVTPHKAVDPPIIVCNEIGLGEYYITWRKVSRGTMWSMYPDAVKHYDAMTKEVLEEAQQVLTNAEWHFLRDSMLIFKNDYLRRFV